MEYKINLDPITESKLTIRLFRNVKNTPELRKNIMDGTLKCAIIKPSLIVDPFVITLAANKALTSPKMITRTVYTEILFNLSISKNITPSLQLFGIDDKETDILVVGVDKVDENGSVFEGIDGEEVDVKTLGNLRDEKAIQKAYKLKEDEVRRDLLGAVCNRICIKDFA